MHQQRTAYPLLCSLVILKIGSVWIHKIRKTLNGVCLIRIELKHILCIRLLQHILVIRNNRLHLLRIPHNYRFSSPAKRANRHMRRSLSGLVHNQRSNDILFDIF